jgi:hypothetical protein
MRKVLAALGAVFFVFPLFMAALTTIAVSTWVLDRDLYTRVVSDTRLYEMPSGAKAEGFLYWPWTPELGAVPYASAGTALKEVVTPEYMRSQAVNLVNACFDFIEGRSQVLDPVIDLTPVKKALSGEGGKRFARALAEALPTCSSSGASLPRNGVLPACRPSGVSVSKAADAILASLPATISKIPDSYRVSDRSRPLLDRGRWSGFFWSFSASRGLLIANAALLFMACCAWILTGLIGGADARGRLYWLGGSLLPPAVLIFLMGLIVNTGVVVNGVRFGIESAKLTAFGFSNEFVNGIFGAAGTMIGRVAAGFLAAGAVAMGIAIALLIWGKSRPRAEASEAAQQPPQNTPQAPESNPPQTSGGTSTPTG